jgi:hypothetical protein
VNRPSGSRLFRRTKLHRQELCSQPRRCTFGRWIGGTGQPSGGTFE